MNTARKIKLYRMLTALAYGDAYGMPTEMMSPHQIDFAFPDGVQSLSSPPKNDFLEDLLPQVRLQMTQQMQLF